MLAIVLLALFVATWVFIARRAQFIDRFAHLLEHGVVHRTPSSAVQGQSSASGYYRGRDVAVRMQLRRSRHVQASLSIAMRIDGLGPHSLSADDLAAHVAADDEGRRAAASLFARDVRLHVEDGWLRAAWQPQGFGIFPADFSEDHWRLVLDDLRVTARSLEAGATAATLSDR